MDADPLSQQHLDLEEPVLRRCHAYGESQKRTTLIEGRARTTYKHRKPIDPAAFVGGQPGYVQNVVLAIDPSVSGSATH